jgi:5-methylcytosine-specific restriction endonuclease McrA
MVKLQCLYCGEHNSKQYKFDQFGGINGVMKLKPFDEDLLKSFYEGQQLERKQKYNSEKVEWFIGYNEYLRSEKWKLKRSLVLKRDNNLCQACLSATANEVHHLTYRHVMNEPLFDLVSVCKRCHDKITDLERSERDV